MQAFGILKASVSAGQTKRKLSRLAEGDPPCGDSDDVFVDAKRNRVYVSCGTGFIDVFELQPGAFRSLERIPTASGARTSLFVPELDVLLLAARATATEPAAIWMFKPEH